LKTKAFNMVKTGEMVVCVKSSSEYYKFGSVYHVYKDKAGDKFTQGKDGIFDPFGKTLSKFRPVNLKAPK